MKVPTALILKVVTLIFKKISPEIKNLLRDFLLTLKEKAAATDNPWDDIVVELLLEIVSPKDQ